ncbi:MULTISPECIES: hypothetical protein [Methylorubrum]|uniref:hypothetical protein n=1 Tax=Methylorubrum TaxID=2282523 RepID=UPI00209D2750|nr:MULTISPECIES: hypothetical protein [Methylorubrum]MCP1550697.1 hypothetical protein [Methylorubrum zatmanii]MCP1552690.1 hypothetical protein [Methylorubrum extorquens]MCP1581000.1 hypothetical protein [Methylorubrum extorquens]
MHLQLQPFLQPLLTKAEAIFGERERGWGLPTLHEHPSGPILDCTSSPGSLKIWLNLGSDPDICQGLYQLSHEVVHCLEPIGTPPATMLEEGMAVWFSIYGPEYPLSDYAARAISHLSVEHEAANYKDAFLYHIELLSYDADAIRKIRAAGRIDDVNAKGLRTVLPSIPNELAARLCERRQMR